MKKATIAILAVALISLGAVFIFAQKGEWRGPRGGGFGPGRGLMMMAEKLGLSEEQKTQVKAILEESKTRVQPLMEAARANHDAIKNLGTDGTFNEAEVNRLAAAQAETTKHLIVEKEKTKAAVFAVLTPEQRVKAAEFKEQMKERFKDRMPGPFGGGRRGGGFGGGFDKD
ncbi:MAG: Spy/CpxP family protein refolding chaperone [Acidobacteria bacterium]|nr:Spy/CpxP family protein refolding chaperone [Acidobacteriota bacterium]